MSELKKLEDLKDYAKYKTDLAKSVAKVGKIPAPVVYIKKFQFATKAAPMALVGPIDNHLKSELVSLKVEMKPGKVIRREDDKLVLDVLNPFQVQEVLKGAAVKDEIDANGDFSKTGFAFLEKHLEDTGRATSDQGKREVATGKILSGIEKSTNERNKAIDPSKPESHHVSAHGPGTDQVSRLVVGRRPDEIEDENAKGKTPTKTTTLTGNAQSVSDTTMPVYDKVGQNASNRSGAFTSNVAMLNTIEEAYAQIGKLDSHLETIIKKEFDKNYETVMKKPAVSEALDKLKLARKAVQAAQLQLKAPSLKPQQAEGLQKQVQTLEKTAKDLMGKFQQAFKDNGGDDKLARPDELNVGDSRVVRTVTPMGKDDPSKKGFMPEGIGSGYEIDETSGIGKQKKGAKLASGGKTEEEVMQERFEAIKPVPGQKSANVVMDPAYVVDKDGTKRRAGWDVQTAYPQSGDAQKSFHEDGVTEDFVLKNKAYKTKLSQLETLKVEHKKLETAYNTAVKNREKHEGTITAKGKVLAEMLKSGKGNPDKIKLEVEKYTNELPALKDKETEAKKLFDPIDSDKTKLELEVETLKKDLGDSE